MIQLIDFLNHLLIENNHPIFGLKAFHYFHKHSDILII